MAKSLGSKPRTNLRIKLSLERDRRFLVRSVRVFSREMTNCYGFPSGRLVENTLTAEFVKSYSKELEQFLCDRTTVATPDYTYTCPGLGVSGLHIDWTEDDGGLVCIELSFERFVGDITRVLLFEQSLEVSTATVRERIAVDVLSDIVSPIFDMLSLSRDGGSFPVESHGSAIQARLDCLSKQQKEMEFYVGLLKRYVAGCQEDAVQAETEMPIQSERLARRIS